MEENRRRRAVTEFILAHPDPLSLIESRESLEVQYKSIPDDIRPACNHTWDSLALGPAEKYYLEGLHKAAQEAYSAAISGHMIAAQHAWYPRYASDIPVEIRDQHPHAWPNSWSLTDAARSARDAKKASAAAKQSAEVTREAAKTESIASWIAEHADETVKEQFADKLLSRNAAVSLIADAAFAAASIPDAADWDSNYCQHNECSCGVTYLDYLPRSVYPAWRTIKSTLPAGYAVRFARVRECLSSDPQSPTLLGRFRLRSEDWDGSDDGAGPAIYLADIKIPHGPFVFERTVRLN